MVTLLTDEHYTTIRNFSRKISKGVNADDLSQHVTLKLLESGLIPDELFNKPKALNVWLYRFINIEFKLCGSSFNKVMHDSYTKGSEVIDKDLTTLNIFEDIKDPLDDINLSDVISKANLKDIERMYLNSYLESGCNYVQCSKNLDIHPQTISKYVNKAIDKCRKLKQY
jgi:hypothetical protein